MNLKIISVLSFTCILGACTVENTEYVNAVPSTYTYTVGYSAPAVSYWNSGYYYPSYGYSRINVYRGEGYMYRNYYHGAYPGVRHWR